jgi:hypothetical protein
MYIGLFQPIPRVTALAEGERLKPDCGTVSVIVVLALRLPEVPAMVTTLVPGAAELLAVNVTELEPLVVAGLKAAVTPAGRPAADRVTLPLKPFWPATVMVLPPVPPSNTLSAPDEEARLKLGTGTVNVIVVLAVRVPEVPAMVTTLVPGAAELLAVNVTELEPLVVAGLKAAVTPAGRPAADRVTLPLKPFWPATEMVLPPVPPSNTLSAPDEEARLKLGTGMVRAMLTLLVCVPAVPVIMTG